MEEGERRYGAGWSERKRRSSIWTLDFQIVPVERIALLGWIQDVIPQVLSNLGERETVIEQTIIYHRVLKILYHGHMNIIWVKAVI